MVTFLQTIQKRLLRYQSSEAAKTKETFDCARQIARAQFQLADDELTRRLWQNVADQGLDVDRILNLLYNCHFQDDRTSLVQADEEFRRKTIVSQMSSVSADIGVFEHC